MESLDELSKTGGRPSFVKHVFNFDEEAKCEMMNIVQYAVLAIIPVVILNKLMQRFVPEADDDKSSMELTMEVLVQVVFMFIMILFIHRLITYVPTYSGDKYVGFSVTNIILAMLVILLSLQTKLGEKVSILVDRVVELWEGTSNKKDKGKGKVKVSQPIAQQQPMQNMQQTTSISSLQPPMYQDNTASPMSTEGFIDHGPQPANMGGSAFGSAFGGGW